MIFRQTRKAECSRFVMMVAVLGWLGHAGPIAAARGSGSSRLASPRQRVVVQVNQAAITESDVQGRLEQLYPSSVAHGGLRPDKLTTLRSQAIHELVKEELIWQEAVRTSQVVAPAKVTAEQQRWRKKFGAANFDTELKRQGITQAQYRKQLQRQMTIREMAKKNVELPSRMTDAEVRHYYEQNVTKFNRPDRVRLQLILVAVKTGTTSDAEREARRKVDGLYQQLKAGQDFAELAHKYSDDMYKVTGGEVGWMHKGSLDPEFETVAFQLPVGEFSAPLRTPAGYNIVKVEGREAARLLKYEEVSARLKRELEDIKAQKLSESWETRLKKAARIRYIEPQAAEGKELVLARQH